MIKELSPPTYARLASFSNAGTVANGPSRQTSRPASRAGTRHPAYTLFVPVVLHRCYPTLFLGG